MNFTLFYSRRSYLVVSYMSEGNLYSESLRVFYYGNFKKKKSPSTVIPKLFVQQKNIKFQAKKVQSKGEFP